MRVTPVPTGTILIVDDNPTNLGVLFSALSQVGFKVLVAEDGERALSQRLSEKLAGRRLPLVRSNRGGRNVKHHSFTLYVAGHTSRSQQAIANLCAGCVKRRFLMGNTNCALWMC